MPPAPLSRARPALPGWLAFALGLLWFCGHGGSRVLWPTTVDWLAQNDWSQHYMGWAYFRHAPWSWPLGSTPGFAAPMGCSLAYADSCPLVAIVLRPLLAWVDGPVQFIGPFLAVAFGLQGLWAARLCRLLGGNVWAQLGAAALLVSFPPLMHRIDHDTLTSHWLLLASTYAALWPLEAAASARHSAAWVAGVTGLVTFAAGTHPYLLAMVWPMLFVATGLHLGRGALPPRAAAAASVALGPWVAFVLYALGYFGGAVRLSDGSYQFFAANFVAWFNPEGWSRLLPNQPVLPGQHFEGFAYLGAGGLLLVAAGLVVRALRWRAFVGARVHKERVVWCALLAACGGMALFAVSDVAHLRLVPVWDVSAYSARLQPLMRTFRSSGRFAWPLTYLALAWSMAAVLRGLSARAAAALLLLAGACELGDVRPQGVAERLRSHGLPPLRDARWALSAGQYDEVAQVPLNIPNSTFRCGDVAYPNKYELPLGLFAAAHNMRVNSAYTARVDDDNVRDLCRAQLAALHAGEPFDARRLYVVAQPFLGFFTRPEARMRCGQLDGYHVCVVDDGRPLANALGSRVGAR